MKFKGKLVFEISVPYIMVNVSEKYVLNVKTREKNEGIFLPISVIIKPSSFHKCKMYIKIRIPI